MLYGNKQNVRKNIGFPIKHGSLFGDKWDGTNFEMLDNDMNQ